MLSAVGIVHFTVIVQPIVHHRRLVLWQSNAIVQYFQALEHLVQYGLMFWFNIVAFQWSDNFIQHIL